MMGNDGPVPCPTIRRHSSHMSELTSVVPFTCLELYRCQHHLRARLKTFVASFNSAQHLAR